MSDLSIERNQATTGALWVENVNSVVLSNSFVFNNCMLLCVFFLVWHF